MAFAGRYPRRALSFAPSGSRRTSGGPGAFWFGDTRTDTMETQETADLPGSWGTLVTVRLGLGPRWDRHARPYGVPTRPPLVSTTRAPDERKLSRLAVQAFRLTAYASSGGSPHHDARRASGCWPALPGGIRTRRVPTEGFRVVLVTSHPPSPGLAWRNDTFFSTPLVRSRRNQPFAP